MAASIVRVARGRSGQIELVLVGGESECSAAPLRPWSATWLLALGGLLAVLVYSAAWDLPAEREVR